MNQTPSLSRWFIKPISRQMIRWLFWLTGTTNDAQPPLATRNCKSTATSCKGFYSIIKSCDAYIRFAFLTGVTKFGQLGVFSGMNNPKDISMHKRYTTLWSGRNGDAPAV